MQAYEKSRCALYKKFKPFWYDIGSDPYALYDCLAVDPEYIANMREAANRIIKVYHKTATLLQHMRSDTFEQLGFPQATFPFLTLGSLSFPSIIQRLDMVYDGKMWKHYELNSDTPTFIMECYRINDQVAQSFGYQGVNQEMEQKMKGIMSEAIIQSLASCQIMKEEAKIVFTAHQESIEDWETSCYLANLLTDFSVEVIPLTDLRIVPKDGLYTKNGERIHLLYRQTYPLECLIEDRDEQTDEAIGYELLHLVRQRKLALCNPISAFLLQSKAVQALIWGLHEMRHECYTELEHQWITAHFLPTYLDAEPFSEKNIPYVEKPVFGREGDTVRIVGLNKETNQALNNQLYYDTQVKIYQKYIALPRKKIHTPDGEIDAHILFGCFVIGDTVGAIGARAGNRVTGNESYFLPIGMKGRIK